MALTGFDARSGGSPDHKTDRRIEGLGAQPEVQPEPPRGRKPSLLLLLLGGHLVSHINLLPQRVPQPEPTQHPGSLGRLAYLRYTGDLFFCIARSTPEYSVRIDTIDNRSRPVAGKRAWPPPPNAQQTPPPKVNNMGTL